MTNETKKMFDAPWKAEEYKHGKGAFVVRNNGGYLVAENMYEQDAARLARLPELYDALVQEIYQTCGLCLHKFHPELISGKTFEEITAMLIEGGCPDAKAKGICVHSDSLKLLKKVRDGE